MKASASILIKKPLDETFTAFSDVSRRNLYIPTVSNLKIVSLHTEGKGVQWHEERKEEGIAKRGDLTITSYNKPRSMAITTHSSGLIFNTRYNFQYAGPYATKVIVSIGGHPKGILSRFMDKFLTQNSVYMGQQLQHELDCYKKALDKSVVSQ
jgi:hypothetical protein